MNDQMVCGTVKPGALHGDFAIVLTFYDCGGDWIKGEISCDNANLLLIWGDGAGKGIRSCGKLQSRWAHYFLEDAIWAKEIDDFTSLIWWSQHDYSADSVIFRIFQEFTDNDAAH